MKDGDKLLKQFYKAPKNLKGKMTDEEYNKGRTYVEEVLSAERKRMWQVYNKKEEIAGIDSTLLAIGIQRLTGMPKTREYKDNIHIIHKRDELLKEVRELQKPSPEYNKLLSHGDVIEQSIVRAMYTNRLRAFEIAIKYNISERNVWKMIKNLKERYICAHLCIVNSGIMVE